MQINWNDYGTPTITATDDLEACRGFGYAQALAHATAILELYGIARGRAAALWGEDFIDGDVQHAQLGLETAIESWWIGQEEQTRTRLQAFCDGFNEACAEDSSRGPHAPLTSWRARAPRAVPPDCLSATEDSTRSSPFEVPNQRDETRSHDG